MRAEIDTPRTATAKTRGEAAAVLGKARRGDKPDQIQKFFVAAHQAATVSPSLNRCGPRTHVLPPRHQQLLRREAGEDAGALRGHQHLLLDPRGRYPVGCRAVGLE